MQKIPLLFISEKLVLKYFKWLVSISSFFHLLVPNLKNDLEEMDSVLRVEEYTIIAFIHSLIYGFMFGSLFGLLLWTQHKTVLSILIISIVLFLVFFFMFLFILLCYPHIISGKKAEELDKSLIFALKDISLQVSSGVSLYNAFVHISLEDYGLISQEFKHLVQDVQRGMSMEKALEKTGHRTRSEYLRRIIWQLINTMKAGASVKGALTTIISDLSRVQKSSIKDYAQELNLWSLLYMLFAVVIPTIGATMLVILSGFGGFQITPVSFISFLIITLIVQLLLIGFIRSRRPLVQF